MQHKNIQHQPYTSEWFLLKIFYLFLERGERRENEEEKHLISWETSIGCLLYALWWGTELTTQRSALTRNWTGNLLLWGTMPNQLSHTSQGWTTLPVSQPFQLIATHLRVSLFSKPDHNSLYLTLYPAYIMDWIKTSDYSKKPRICTKKWPINTVLVATSKVNVDHLISSGPKVPTGRTTVPPGRALGPVFTNCELA